MVWHGVIPCVMWMHFWVIFANIIAISPRFTGVFKVGDACRHRAGVSEVATFPEPVSVVNRRSTQTFLYLLTYIWRPGRNSVSSWLDHVGSSDVHYNMLSQLNVSTGLKKLLFRLAPLVDTAHGLYSSPEKSETAPIELLGIPWNGCHGPCHIWGYSM